MTKKDFTSIKQLRKTFGFIKRKDNSSRILKHSFSLYIIKNPDNLKGFLETIFLGLYDTEEQLNQAIKNWNL